MLERPPSVGETVPGEQISMENRVLGDRLRAHRIAAGWSLRDLSKRLGQRVSAQALSQYEKGQTRPRNEVLEALANAFGTHPEHLGREPDPVTLGTIQFRHPTALSPTLLAHARGWLITRTERSLALEQRLGGPMVSPSLPRIDEIRHIREPEDAEEIAQDARRRWGLGTGPLPPQLVSLFESRGIRVFECATHEVDPEFNGCSAFVSYSIASESNFPVILLNGSHWGERKRFSLCHELAHLILPSSMHAVLPDDVQERLANWFAGALLLPAARLRELLGRKRKNLSWFELAEIKKQYGASYQAITYRCRQAGIISRERFRNLFEEYKRMGWRNFPYREHLPIEPEDEASTRLQRLGLRGVAEGIISQHEAAVLLNTCSEELDGWMSPPEAIAGRATTSGSRANR